MKVLHVLWKLSFSGAEIMYAAAAEEFRHLGCELYAINAAEELGEYASRFEAAGYKVLHLPYPAGRWNFLSRWRYCMKTVRLVRAEKIDVIHIHSYKMKWCMSLAARIAGIRAVYTFHTCFTSNPITYPYKWWLRWSARHLLGCRFQSISDSVWNNERTFWHTDTTKIYNWYDNRRFFPASDDERQAVRRKLGIPQDTVVIVSVGGCSPIKRHEDIIKALPDLCRELGDVLYLHLGCGPSTEEEVALTKELGVQNCVRFLGNRDDVRPCLIASDAYVMTSRHEGISISTIEALACKVPAILYDVPGLRDFNAECQCSILIHPHPEQIVRAVHTLMSDAALRETIIENGYAHVRERYFLPDNVKKICNLYHLG